MISETQFTNLLPECCRIGFASINNYSGEEKEQLLKVLPSTKTVVVIAHHVQDSLEWTWLKFSAAFCNETSPADIHCLSIAERIENHLHNKGFKSEILPYPGICGSMFKTIATKTGLGKLGDNFLFMNKDWGPWIHLRVLLTNAIIDYSPRDFDSGCNHCGECIATCPVGAISSEGFNGLVCRDGMLEMSKIECDGSYVYECEKCLRACPIGTQPRAVEVKYKEQQIT